MSGLRVPIDGRFGPGGALSFGARLHRRTLRHARRSASSGSARRGCRCARPVRRSSSRRAGGPVQFGLGDAQLALRGRLGNSPFALNAAQARMLGQREFAASGLALRLGKADAPVADQCQHACAGLSRAAGFAGPSPAPRARSAGSRSNLSDASGKWRFYNSDLTIDGGLTVSDARRAAQILSAAQRQHALHARRRPDPRDRHAQASGQRDAHRRRRRSTIACPTGSGTPCSTCPASTSARGSSPRS